LFLLSKDDKEKKRLHHETTKLTGQLFEEKRIVLKLKDKLSNVREAVYKQ
jgi:hypothetical protein